MQVKLQGYPVFARGWCFYVWGGIEDGWLVFQVRFDVYNMLTKFVLACVDRRWKLLFKMPSFFFLKSKMPSWVRSLCRPPKHAAKLVLDQWDMSMPLCLRDLLCTSWIVNLT